MVPPPNAYTVSCVPWISFEHFAVHNYDNKAYYFPSVEAGKFYEEEGRLLLPLSMTCHHATTDGYHVSLFLEQDGLFIFDVKSREMFRQMAGQSSVYEDEDCYCTWQYGFDGRSGLGEHVVDLFFRQGDGSYLRRQEIHLQKAFSRKQIETVLDKCDLDLVGVYQDLSTRKATEEEGRLLFVARKR
jgi:hypothetical protein